MGETARISWRCRYWTEALSTGVAYLFLPSDKTGHEPQYRGPYGASVSDSSLSLFHSVARDLISSQLSLARANLNSRRKRAGEILCALVGVCIGRLFRSNIRRRLCIQLRVHRTQTPDAHYRPTGYRRVAVPRFFYLFIQMRTISLV